MEQHGELQSTLIEDRWCVARHALVHGIRPNAGVSCNAESAAAFTDRKRQTVTRVGERMMAGSAGHVEVPAKYLVEEQLGAKFDQRRIRRAVVEIVGVRHRGRKLQPVAVIGNCAAGH